jgi:hypothetical protein
VLFYVASCIAIKLHIQVAAVTCATSSTLLVQRQQLVVSEHSEIIDRYRAATAAQHMTRGRGSLFGNSVSVSVWCGARAHATCKHVHVMI